MNKIYRTVYSQVLGAWIAVSELAAAKGKRSGSSRSANAPAAAQGAVWEALLAGGLPLKASVLALTLALPLSGYAATIANGGGSGCGPSYTGLDGTVFTAPGAATMYQTDGSNYYSIVAGCGASGGGFTAVTLFGTGTQVKGNYGTAMGFMAQAGTQATAVGVQATATGNSSVALGLLSQATQTNSVAIGSGGSNTAPTIANSTTAGGAGAVAIGGNATKGAQALAAAGPGGVAVGRQPSQRLCADGGLAAGGGPGPAGAARCGAGAEPALHRQQP